MTSEVQLPLTWLRSLFIYLFTRMSLEEKTYVKELRRTADQEIKEATAFGLNTSPG